MAVVQTKKCQNVTSTATENELQLTGVYPPGTFMVTLEIVSGTVTFSLGGPTNDTSLRGYTTAGTKCQVTVDGSAQFSTTSDRIHYSGVGVFTVTF